MSYRLASELRTAPLSLTLHPAGHPGVVYRNGPTGWRASLVAGADVWEVVLGVQSARGEGSARIADTQAQMDLTETQVRAAMTYAAAYPDEIDARIAANNAAADRSRR